MISKNAFALAFVAVLITGLYNLCPAQFAPPTVFSGNTPSNIPWSTVATGTSLPIRTQATNPLNGAPGAVVFYDTTSGEIAINPRGLALTTFILTYTYLTTNVSASTTGPFNFPLGTAASSCSTCQINSYSSQTGSTGIRTFPAKDPLGSGLAPTTFQTRIGLTIGAPLSAPLAITGDPNNIASSASGIGVVSGATVNNLSGFFNLPWSFGKVVVPDSVSVIKPGNFRTVNQGSNLNANILGFGSQQCVFQYSVNGVTGNQIGAVIPCKFNATATPTCTAPTLSASTIAAICQGTSTGSVDLTITGGSPTPLGILWSNGATSEDLSNVAAGTYTVTVTTDGGGCTATGSYTVADGPAPTLWYADADSDGYGDANVSQSSCTQPGGYVANSTDCNDGNNSVNPGASETCNSVDDDCDGQTDEGLAPAQPALACYETVTYNTATCSWDVTGTQPVQPTLACYQTATFNTTTCQWDVTGTQPSQPNQPGSGTPYFNAFSTTWLPAGAQTGTLAGTVDMQNGWTTRDAFTTSTIIGKWDQQVIQVNDANGNRKVFRMSNAIAFSTYPSQVFSATSAQAAGETNAALWNNRGTNGLAPLSPTQFGAYASSPTFYTKLKFRSATGAAQTGLQLVLSPSAKQSAVRMSFLQIQDVGTGYKLNFYETGANGGFAPSATVIASGLSYTELHTLEMEITFVDGVTTVGGQVFGNDVVKIWLNGTLIHTGTTWESYYYTSTAERNAVSSGPGPRLQAVNAVLFRVSAPAAPANSGNGFYFEDFEIGNTIPTRLACYQSYTFNNTTCAWEVSGTQPAQPTLACYQTATFNTTTCVWDVTGVQPTQPSTACYETATFNNTTCVWEVTGTQPSQPSIACYETATFNGTTCQWYVTGTQPSQPGIACYETATFNGTTCQWDVTGTQPTQPSIACYESATFNGTTCQWEVTGTAAAPIVTTESVCDIYTWAQDGQTYTASGTYSSNSNCQDYVLNLTISASTVYYADADNDGYGSNSNTTSSCAGAPTGYVSANSDCNDGNNSVNPGVAADLCNGVDNDCDGSTDEDATFSNYYVDADGDGYGAGAATSSCAPIAGSVTTGGDCNDLSSSINPAATEVCNSIDDDCDGSVDDNLPPLTAGNISGTSLACRARIAGTATFTLNGASTGASYLWSVPAGFSITSGQGTSTLNVSYTASAIDLGISGPLCMIISDACGSSATACTTIDYQIAAPVTPPSISGPTKPCPGDTAIFSIANVARATAYSWSMPQGVTLLNGQGSNIIQVTIGAGFTGGNISVIASNACGSSPARTKNVLNAGGPPTPTAISGLKFGLCNGTGVVYTANAVTGATSYLWSVTGGGLIMSGQGTSSITVNYPTFTSGNVNVQAANSCGASQLRTLYVTGAPGKPEAVTGAASVCRNASEAYSVPTVNGTANNGYNWTVTSAGTITSGQGTKNITVLWHTAASGQALQVNASNACGTGPNNSRGNITVSACSRTEFSTAGMQMELYPNPAQDRTHVVFNTHDEKAYNLRLTDMSGRTMLTETGTTSAGRNEFDLYLGNVQAGIYFVEIQTDGEYAKMRIVIAD